MMEQSEQTQQEQSQDQLSPPFSEQPSSPSEIDDEDEAQKRLRVMHACLLCKKDHTACEAQRPCSRCIAKGVECVDAEHKKRGRKPKQNLSQNGGYDDQPSPPQQSQIPTQPQPTQQPITLNQMTNNGRSSGSFLPQQKRRKLNEGGA